MRLVRVTRNWRITLKHSNWARFEKTENWRQTGSRQPISTELSPKWTPNALSSLHGFVSI